MSTRRTERDAPAPISCPGRCPVILGALAVLLLRIGIAGAQPEAPGLFTIARVQYDGGGDWYSDPSSLPNLLAFVNEHTRVRAAANEARVRLTDRELFSYPYLYLTGHGNIRFSDAEAARLRAYLEGGGFLHADDNYGMDASFRREMKKVFPTRELVELPPDHEVFHTRFDFPEGLPKIHEHDGKPAQALGLFDGDRLMVLYSYQSDLGDGWEDATVHGDPEALRLAALRMGTNIIVYALTH